jgi:hypothetical protein
MAQLGEVVRGHGGGGSSRGERLGAAVKRLVLLVLAVVVVVAASPTSARAQTAAPDDKADCRRRYDAVEKIIAKDAYYAHAWTDSWYFAGTTSAVLSLTRAFQYGDYIRGESLTFAATSLLLMIQRPLALTSDDALRGIRTSLAEDPCLALADARSILMSNQVDGEKHRDWPLYVIPVVFNLAVMGILTGVTRHWDFAGHSDLGLNTLVGTALSELQVYTYPSGSLKAAGTSLELTF